MIGVCLHCGSYDNLYLAEEISLTKIALKAVSPNAEIQIDNYEEKENIAPPGRFYCDNCNQYFNYPRLVE
jgi:hypothetical protein